MDEPPGVFITTTPRRVAASRSTLSTPTPARPTTRSRVAFSRSFAVTFVALRTASASYPPTIASSSAGGSPTFTSTSSPASRRIRTASGERSSDTSTRAAIAHLLPSDTIVRRRGTGELAAALPDVKEPWGVMQIRERARARARARLRARARARARARSRGTPKGSPRAQAAEHEVGHLPLHAVDLLLGLRRHEPDHHPGDRQLEGPQDPGRRDHRIEVRLQLASTLPPLDDAGDELHRLRERLAGRPRPQRVGRAGDLEDEHAHRGGRGLVDVEDEGMDPRHLVGGGARPLVDGADRVDEDRPLLGEDALEQLVLVPEVVVHEAVRDVRGAGDVRDPATLISLLREHPHRGVEDGAPLLRLFVGASTADARRRDPAHPPILQSASPESNPAAPEGPTREGPSARATARLRLRAAIDRGTPCIRRRRSRSRARRP